MTSAVVNERTAGQPLVLRRIHTDDNDKLGVYIFCYSVNSADLNPNLAKRARRNRGQ